MLSLKLYKKVFYISLLIISVGFLTGANAQRDIKTINDNAEPKIAKCNSSVKVLEAYDLTTVAHFFLLADEEIFKKKSLLNFFTCVSKSYPEYMVFQITVFSDKKNLEIALDNYLNPPPHTNPPVNFGDRPAITGYYRAEFYRYNISNKEEYFEYSPNPDDGSLITIYLKNKKPIKVK